MADFSHSVQRIQAPATLSKKMSNGNGFTSKTVYDDVFGGPPKYGVPTFSSRVDDYSEIFSSYHASRGSSIPILDLPVVDEGDVSIDVRSSKFDYSEVFGGFNSVDFAVSYEELLAEPKGGESSSEDVWTPAETGSPSEGSSEDPACSESNQAFLNGESHHSYDGVKQFNMSYHKANQISKEDGISGTTYIAELNAVPAFTFVVDESIPLDKTGGDKPLPQVTNDYDLNVNFNGEIMVGEHFRKTMSDQPICSTVARTPDSDLTPQRNPVGNGTYPNKVFVSVSEISLRTQPSQVPPPSRPPPKLTIKQGESKRFVASNLNVSENSSLEGAVTNGSPPFFDVEIDASSSAAASAAAMKEAMEIAQARLKCAKESMERKREGLHNRKKLGLKDDLKGKERRESETTLEARRFNEEKAHESFERENGETRGFAKEGGKTTTMAAQMPLDFEARGKLPNVSNEAVYQKHVKESRSTQESHQQEEAGEWKAEEQFYELVKTDKFRTVLEAPEKEKSERKFMPTTKAYECDQNEKKAAEVAFKQPEESYGKSKAACEQEDGWIFEEAIEVHEWEENEKKIKEAHKQEEREKKLQEAHEREEHEKKLKEAYEQAENEKKLKEAYKREEIEKKQKEAREREENEKREKMAHEREANEKRLKKAREQEAYEKRLKEVRELEEHEKRLKEACEREENEKRLREACEREAYEKRLKEVREQEELEKRLKEVREREENEKRLKEALEREENEKMLKQVREQEENEKRRKEESEREEHEKRLNEAREREENDKRQKEARKRELNEKRLMDARELEENEKKQREAHEREKKEKRGKEALEQEENGTREQEACKREDNEEKLEAAEGAHVHEEKDLNAVMELQESSESENKLKSTNEACKMGEDKNITRGAFELDENNKKLKENQDSCEHKGNGKRMDENERLKEPHMAQSADEHKECENKSKPTSQAKLEGNGNKLGEPEEVVGQGKNEKNKKVDQVSFGREDNRNKNRAAQGMSTLVENGKKMEAAKPANALEERGDKLDTVDEVDRKRKDKNFNKVLILEEREKEERLQREREQEKERLRKIEEEKDREREREKDRMAVERATREARERAFTEARERAERAAVERATAEARQRAMAEAREKLEKASAEAREKSLAEKASIEGRLRAERAAVERATAEARERAVERAMAGKAALEARERVERSVSEKFSATSRDSGIRQSSSFSDLRDPQFQSSSSFSSSQRYSNSSHLGAFAAERSQGSEVESAQRCKARLERHQRTVERAAKALAEKNMRDRLAQREQAERNRLAETLDADVKRWSSGKEGNLRALLSTLQYILGTESGWQPIPLTDVITAVAVKKAYRKATLCVHPDKLQQRGASIQQKYICEKVFDLLKEAWNKFNSEER